MKTPRGKSIDKNYRLVIEAAALEFMSLPRTVIATNLIKVLEAKGLTAPTVSTVEKMISSVRNGNTDFIAYYAVHNKCDSELVAIPKNAVGITITESGINYLMPYIGRRNGM